MNRFFSKLDLRDIKIDPEGSRFPPDDEEGQELAGAEDGQALTDHAVAEIAEPEELAPVAPVSGNYDPYPVDDQPAPAASNGHMDPETIPATVGTVATEQGDEILKVSARSRPSAVAGAIAGVVRERGRAEVQAIGAGATNQAVKAAAIARDYLSETGIDAVCLPAFIDVIIDNEERTAIRILIEPR